MKNTPDIGCLLAICLSLFCCPVAWSSEGALWELTFEYEGHELSLLMAARVPPMRKQSTEPDLESSPLVVHCELDWLDAEGNTLSSSQIGFPLGAWFDDATNRTGGVTIPTEGCCPVRVSGPPPGLDPSQVRLRRAAVVWNDEALRHEGVPEAFRFEELTLALNEGLPKLAVEPGPVGITKINDAGDDENRIVMVILGDGYTEQNLAGGVFEEDVEQLMEAYRTSPPWNDYLQAVNIYRIDVVSRQQGVDLLDSGVFVDAYLNGNITGLTLRVNDGKVGATIFQYLPPVWPDSILVLCNTPVYSGHGADRVATSYNGESMVGVSLQVQGFQFGDLAPEYESGWNSHPGANSCQNWDTTFDRDLLKWRVWVDPDTPLPTPETPEFSHVVGAFEGAHGWPTDAYRPYLDCCMRSLDPPFCPVCQEVLSTRIISPLELADSANPDIGTTIPLDSDPTTISVTPLGISPLTFEWKVAGTTLAGETEPSLTLTLEALGGAPSAELELTIGHPTPRIRKTSIFKRMFPRRVEIRG